MNNYRPVNVLVTGGAGFIGSNFIRMLLASDPALRVINLDKLTYAGSVANLDDLPHPDRHQFVQGDICDFTLVNHLLRSHHIDTVVHFAAESHVDRSINGPGDFIQTNIVGTFTLLEACRQYWLIDQQKNSPECRFHHISTDEVFGSLTLDAPPFSEAANYAPNSPYSASKAGSDHIVRAYGKTYGLPVTTSHCSNNYGPWQHAEKLIPTIILACFNNRPIPIYGTGENIRDWLYVEDHCEAIGHILSHGQVGETYNIGGNAEWQNLDIAREICQLMDDLYPRASPYEQLITLVQDRPGHDWRYAIDSHKIEHELRWQPKTTLRQGLELTIRFYGRRQ